MKFTYNREAYCINNYYVCVKGHIMGILLANVLLEFEKGRQEWVSKTAVFETSDEAIGAKIAEIKDSISICNGILSDPSETKERKDRVKIDLEFNLDAIDFLTSQLESEQEGF